MADARPSDGRDEGSDPRSEVEVTVVVRARRRPLRERLDAVRLPIRARLLAAVLAVVGALLAGGLVAAGSIGLGGERDATSPGGPRAAVAAAYRYPANCLTVTISTTDPTYARAELDRVSPCWRYGVYVTAIFHRVGGSWRPLLNSSRYSCPVASLPAVVQQQLAVCPER
jgi:hypothetical protein